MVPAQIATTFAAIVLRGEPTLVLCFRCSADSRESEARQCDAEYNIARRSFSFAFWAACRFGA